MKILIRKMYGDDDFIDYEFAYIMQRKAITYTVNRSRYLSRKDYWRVI